MLSRMTTAHTIYVYLLGEGVPVWVPVDAERVCDDIYRILDCRWEDEVVQFGKDTLVRCRLQKLSGDHGRAVECPLAFEALRAT